MVRTGSDGTPWATRAALRAAEAPEGALGGLIAVRPGPARPLDPLAAPPWGRAAENALAAVLDAVPQAVLLVDARGRLHHANAAGWDLLRQGGGLCLVAGREGPGRLAAAWPPATRRLRQLLGRAAFGSGGWMQLARPGGAPGWPVLAMPLPGMAACPLVAVLVGGAGAAPAVATLRDAFGLTAAQAQVLRCIAAGAGVPGAAAALGLSAETVRTHLARCFDATGVRSQAALAALVARLPQLSEPG